MLLKLSSAVQFKLYLAGCAFLFSGVYGIFTLISSIHIENGIGSMSLAISYSTSFFISLSVPILVKVFGARSLFLFGCLSYCLFAAGNAYTTHITMILAGIFYSIGNCLVWPIAGLFNVHFAKMKCMDRSDAAFNNISKRYFGYYYSMFSISEVVGNAVMYVILTADRHSSSHEGAGNGTEIEVDKSYCGANDCQLSEVTEFNKGQYNPVNVNTQYVVTGTCCSFVLTSFALFFLALPRDVSEVKSESEDGSAEDPFLEMSSTEKQYDHENRDGSVLSQIRNSISELFVLLVSYKHLHIIPIAVYTGLSFAFVHTEMSRAFASCVLGLNHVSVCFIAFASMYLVSSTIFSRVAGRFGRNIPFAIAYVLDMFIFVFSLYVDPVQMQQWTVYGLFLAFGFTQAIWMPLVNELYTDLFRDQKETAVAVYQIMFSLGNLLVFSFSTTLCVYIKLYVLIAELSAGLVVYAIGQYFISRHSRDAVDHDAKADNKVIVDENQNVRPVNGKIEMYTLADSL